MAGLHAALTIADLKQRARRRVPKMFFDYADSGSWTEQTYRDNEADFKKIQLRQRVAVNLENRNLASTMIGQPVAMPVAMAPVGLTGMQIADGEIKAAKAAEKFGVPFTLSTMSICSIEDVAENTTKPFWFQLYVMRDRAFIERLIDRAKAAKCSALVLTMDLQILGQRHKDLRNGLSAPPKFTPKHIWQIATRPAWALGMLGTRRHTFGNLAGHVTGAESLSSVIEWTNAQFDPALSWADVGWVKKRFGGKVIVKGILDADDARWRPAPMRSSSPIMAGGSSTARRRRSGSCPRSSMRSATRPRCSWTAASAPARTCSRRWRWAPRATFVGRAFLYGLGAGGEAGVTRALEIIARELDVTMALCGERSVSALGPHNVYSNGLSRR